MIRPFSTAAVNYVDCLLASASEGFAQFYAKGNDDLICHRNRPVEMGLDLFDKLSPLLARDHGSSISFSLIRGKEAIPPR
jgi:hypothetical protein